MRLSFANNEHADVLVAPGNTSIGSASDNTIVLTAAGMNPHHATLTISERSIVLAAGDVPARIHVNARPVREKALLRLGDAVSLDTVTFVLKPDRDDSIQARLPTPAASSGDDADKAAARSLPARVVLRGVSGPWFGKIVPVRGRLNIGSGSDCDLVLDDPEVDTHHATIELAGDSILLRASGAHAGSAVNGVAMRDAVVFADDQIAFGRNRFVLEAPSLPIRESAGVPAGEVNITQTMRAIPRSAPPPSAEPVDERAKNDIWWLIGAAALIAVGIAILLYVSF